jgi:hypothetical protein
LRIGGGRKKEGEGEERRERRDRGKGGEGRIPPETLLLLLWLEGGVNDFAKFAKFAKFEERAESDEFEPSALRSMCTCAYKSASF